MSGSEFGGLGEGSFILVQNPETLGSICFHSHHYAQGPALGVSFRKCPQKSTAHFSEPPGRILWWVLSDSLSLPSAFFTALDYGLKDLLRWLVFWGFFFALA